MTDEQINQRFDQLWASLKEQVMAARGERAPIYTMCESVMTQRDGFRFSIGNRTRDERGALYNHIHLSVNSAEIHSGAYREELIGIAAHCLAAAMEIEDDEKNRKP